MTRKQVWPAGAPSAARSLTRLYYGDVVGGVPISLAAFEFDAVEYTFRSGLPVPTFEDGAPESLEILGLACTQRGWPYALSAGDPYVAQIVHNVLRRFTSSG